MSAWIDQIFEADAAKTKGVVRRSLDDVNKYGGKDGIKELKAEAKRRGFHVVQIGLQVVILCNRGEMIVHC